MNATAQLFYLIAVAVVLIAVGIFAYIHTQKKRREKLAAQFGQVPLNADQPVPQSVAQYWKERVKHENIAHYIDDITWDDLDMDKVYARINSCHTTVGQEGLYAILREPVFNSDALAQREALIRLLTEDEPLRLDLQVIFTKMGKSNDNGLSSFCYDASSKRIKRPYIYKILAFLPLVCIAVAIFLSVPLGLICLMASSIANGIIFYFINKHMQRELAALRYFTVLLWCAKNTIKTPQLFKHGIADAIKQSYIPFKRTGIKLSTMFRERVSVLDAIWEYYKILFLVNIRTYNRTFDVIERNIEAFRSLYHNIGELDAAIAVSSYRASLPYYCQPDLHRDDGLAIQEIYHPLLKDPVPNTVDIAGSSLISGSNASGKSTFIKAVAIAGIFAQTIHTCLAKTYRARFALVMTSMAVRDNITAGESYFITEIKSLRRIIQKIPETYCLCFIDEILKGTNTIERIAASAAVLAYLQPFDCLCLVATHDIELTRMLKGTYDNYHFREHITEDGIAFDYTIKQGPSTTKNAIKLLGHLAFDEKIIDSAQTLVDKFEHTQSWE